MKRLFAIFLLVFLAIGSAGVTAGTAAAGPANCAFNATTQVEDAGARADKADAMAELVALTEKMSPRTNLLAEGQQLVCNSSCARACSARFGSCGTRECRQQFSACVRSCGC